MGFNRRRKIENRNLSSLCDLKVRMVKGATVCIYSAYCSLMSKRKLCDFSQGEHFPDLVVYDHLQPYKLALESKYPLSAFFW